MADADEKQCSTCRELKPVADFAIKRCKGRKTRTSGQCRVCERAYYAKRRAKKKDTSSWKYSRRMTQIKTKYQLTKEQYIDFMLVQDFRCAICSDPVAADRWFVDHDHACCPGEKSCGKCVRGLLDQKCNTMIGMALDNIATLAKAQAYLEVNSAHS